METLNRLKNEIARINNRFPTVKSAFINDLKIAQNSFGNKEKLQKSITDILEPSDVPNELKEIINDERTYTIAGKAARLTLQIVAIGMAIIGVILLIISHGESSALTRIGFPLEFATCALLIINYITYYYYNRKLGGKA